MNRALVRYLLQARALLIAEIAFKSDGAFDAMNETFEAARAFEAIFGVDSLLAQADGDTLDRPAFAPRVEHDCHGGAAAQGREQERIRVWT